MENFYSGDTRTLLLRLEIKPEKEGEVLLGKFRLSYFDVLENTPKTIMKNVVVTTTDNIDDVKAAENKEVVVESILIDADDKHEKFVRMYEKGSKKEALQNIKELTEELTQKNAELSDIKVAKKLEALKMEAQEIEDAEKSEQQRATYLKRSKQRFYGAKKGLRSKYILEEGMSGYDVERLQQALTDKGFYNGPIDGTFSPEVKKAVESFQKQQNLTADGVVGPLTLKALGLY